ncbi:MAG: ABC transporter ATP-binding protein [Gemmatimonadaceae bacterium]|nr:ABC transporter ATP-binding protein [Gemmatimonadaceae bacterium]
MSVQSTSVEEPVVQLHEVTKQFTSLAGVFTALDAVTLEVKRGELLALVGHSGSGKSTLLHLVSGIERITSGRLLVAGAAVPELDEAQMARWRGRHVGIVFQSFQLIPTLTAVENVTMAMDFVGRWPRAEREERAHALLTRLGVNTQAEKLPATLSGGQQQRVAIARALANTPDLIVADEPTGNLDSRTAQEIYKVFAELVADGHTVIMATHDPAAQEYATRTEHIMDGRLLATVDMDAAHA